MSDETNKHRCVGIVEMDDMSSTRLTRLMEDCSTRLYTGDAVYNELQTISIALQDIHCVRSETAKIIAEGVSQRVFGLVASLLGIDGKGGNNGSK